MDTFLVKSLKRGDVSALEKIYKNYYSKIFSYAKRFGLQTLEPDDFVQQTFLLVWEKKDQLEEEVLLDKQLFVICKNLIINHLKREARDLSHFECESVEEEKDVPGDNNNRARLFSIIQRLPKKRKEIFLLHKIENLTYSEIAEYLSISKRTIANHIYQAQQQIQKEIKKSQF
ncbi:sigma-70 family RNA polymerase sigma factor [Antarcticibacterium sp. 1MA-6-2]|uniref:RNA polymerase sigma factor n=1 Tax=Antarcticibacterium sp. 1MA-6-2 TaxID=2908210 RepID=UPI001F34BA2A|nr:sigma-70 family RNA polymerase sigma factor [Antarcticibacterium sp. 1MA-6-2]UJH92998.1 sigma-70 family RNA polymerase sigma factor [Antarcticibacterium sp. 1MA-6-2]